MELLMLPTSLKARELSAGPTQQWAGYGEPMRVSLSDVPKEQELLVIKTLLFSILENPLA
jgi:hypothetical protein